MARRKRNSAKVNLIISVVLHSLAVLLIFFFAAREGLVGKKLQTLMATIVPKEKPPEEVKPPEPRIEPPKDEPKPEPTPAPAQETAPTAPPPATETATAVAPPAVDVPSFDFSDGAKVVESSTNSQVAFYKNFVEYTFRTHWNRPELDVSDDKFVAEVEVQVDKTGKVTNYALKKNSGNKSWDDSVVKAVESSKTIGRLPPTNFPPTFLVRFDVLPATENAFE